MTQEEKIQALRDLGYNIQIIDGKPTVKGWVDLRETNITSLPDNLVVGGWLDLRGLKITSLPDNLVVSGDLDFGGTEITSLPDNLVVGGCLDLRYTKIKSLPDNLVVGDSLYICGTKIPSLPNNLVVNGSLYLNGTMITSLPDNLAVGKFIFKRDGKRISTNQNTKIDFVQKIWGDKPYCKVDGIFTEIVNRRGKVWTVREIGHTDTFYLVTDGNGNYAHGRTIKQAKADLVYKITNKDKSDYKDLTLESVLTHDEAIKCYRVITGACTFGTRNFVEHVLPTDKRKDQYTIAEIICLTKGRYGNEMFTEFFKNNK